MSRAGLLADVRRSLHLGPEEERALREAAALLGAEVPGWVDGFYARLVTDPVAMALLADESRVLRLKRSLTAWFHELFALPLDAAYAQAREEIGRAHVRIGMPAYLMVTAMSHLRADVRRSTLRRLAAEPERAERTARAAEKHLDLELALMLTTFAQHGRQVERRRERALLLERVARGLLGGARDTLDAALCYAELLRREGDAASRARWSARLGDLLRRLGSGDAGGLTALAALDDPPQRVAVAALVEAASASLGAAERARVEVLASPAPPDALVRVVPLQQALAEVLRWALLHGAAGTVTLRVGEDDDGALVLEVRAPGAGRDDAAGPALAYAELVANLHGGGLARLAVPGGGECVRLVLGPGEVG